MPLYQSMIEVLPGMEPALHNILKNSEKWQSYEETEEDMKVYTKKSVSTTNLTPKMIAKLDKIGSMDSVDYVSSTKTVKDL